MLVRQNEGLSDQFSFPTRRLLYTYLFIGLLCLWFAIVISEATAGRWSDQTVVLYICISAAVGAFLAQSIFAVYKWKKSAIRPRFYVSQLYFIRTHFDFVEWFPILFLKRVYTTHHLTNGSYRYSTVDLQVDSGIISFTIVGREQAELAVALIQEYARVAKQAIEDKNSAYFTKYDDFSDCKCTDEHPNRLKRKKAMVAIYAIAILSTVSFTATMAVIANAANGSPGPSLTTQSRESIGYTAVQPSDIQTYRAKHLATATQAPATQSSRPSPLPLPDNGSLQIFTSADRIAPLEIAVSGDTHFFVKLVNVNTKEDAITVFVQKGNTVNFDVPVGTYEVRYATGDAWYGYHSLFGENTTYFVAEDRFYFYETTDNHVSGYTLHLYKSKDGNLKTSRIDKEAF